LNCILQTNLVYNECRTKSYGSSLVGEIADSVMRLLITFGTAVRL